MKILNLGCGTKTSDHPDVVNIDWSFYLRFKQRKLLSKTAPWVFRGKRLQKFNALSDNIVVHNLAKGIPAESGTVDAVYHSHLLEHLDRDVAKAFLLEAYRVLKPGGVHRIAVPDLEEACESYMAHIAECEANPAEYQRHDAYIAVMIEQCVRRQASETGRQSGVRRFIENLALGDARKRGETHQWMYDRINLPALMTSCGYRDARVQQFNASLIPQWTQYGLDTNKDGSEYKEDSLYVEAVK